MSGGVVVQKVVVVPVESGFNEVIVPKAMNLW